ncbi:MAG: hypothetical protein JWM33_3884, partial [Caulobacteraceae bacterium]|nr:hypothetical protein [Caulobacteraceae bacterium]
MLRRWCSQLSRSVAGLFALLGVTVVISAAAAPQSPRMADKVSGDVADLPVLWGGQRLSAASAPIGAPIIPVDDSRPLPLDLEPPSVTDQVSALIVEAPSKDHVPGPAWWKVTRGGATLWIMATPDRMPTNIRFDDG